MNLQKLKTYLYQLVNVKFSDNQNKKFGRTYQVFERQFLHLQNLYEQELQNNDSR